MGSRKNPKTTRSLITEADQFVYLCNEVVYEGTWLASIDSKYTDDRCVVLLVGVLPGRSASVTWGEGMGFSVKITKPDSYYSESRNRVSTAEEALALVSLLGCD